MKTVIDRGKSKTLCEVKPVKNISKNLQSFLEVSHVQKEVLLSHKLHDHVLVTKSFWTKNYSLQLNRQNQLSHPILSHIEQECQESLIEGKIHIQQNSHIYLKYLKCKAKLYLLLIK